MWDGPVTQGSTSSTHGEPLRRAGKARRASSAGERQDVSAPAQGAARLMKTLGVCGRVSGQKKSNNNESQALIQVTTAA